jgi:hypothetical protein
MSEDVLEALYDKYPSTIAKMPETFTSHEFILRLAHEHQKLYVEALHHYRDYEFQGKPAPFRRLHNPLGRHIAQYDDLVEQVGLVKSEDIFRNTRECAKWKKL